MSAIEKIAVFGASVVSSGAVCAIAKVTRITSNGKLAVRVKGKTSEFVVTDVVSDACQLAGDLVGRDVLVVLPAGDSDRSILIGPVDNDYSVEERRLERDTDDSKNPLVIEAPHEIQIKCGQGSITMREDGTIVVRGRRLISRASEEQKIKGAVVRIN